METSASLLERLAVAPSDDDWRRLDDLYRPLLRAWMARAGVAPCDADDLRWLGVRPPVHFSPQPVRPRCTNS
jgi:hypothetical protein